MAKAPRAQKAPTSTQPAAAAAGSQSPEGAAGAAAPAGGADQEPPATEPSSVSTDGSGEIAAAQDPAAAVSNDTQRASQEAEGLPPAADPAAAGADGEPLLITARSRDGQAYRRGGVVWTATFAPQLVAADQAGRVWADPHLEIEGEAR